MSDSSIEPELTSLLTKLTAENESNVKEVEALKKKIAKNEHLIHALKGSLGMLRPAVKNSEYGTKLEIIQRAIEGVPKPQFTQNDVEAEIKRTNPEMVNRNRIRSALWTLANESIVIKQIRKGSNQQEALYEKIAGSNRAGRITERDKDQQLTREDSRHGTTPSGQITAHMLEEAVQAAAGRIEQLAMRLKTNTTVLESLLAPASKVYVGRGGWLRIKE